MVVRQQQDTKHLRHRNLWHVSLLCPFTTHCRHSPQTSLPALRSRVERMDLTYRWIWSILLLWLAVTGRLIRATPPPDEMDALLEELLKDVPETAGPSSSHNLAPVEPHLITDRSWNELFHTTYSEHHNPSTSVQPPRASSDLSQPGVARLDVAHTQSEIEPDARIVHDMVPVLYELTADERRLLLMEVKTGLYRTARKDPRPTSLEQVYPWNGAVDGRFSQLPLGVEPLVRSMLREGSSPWLWEWEDRRYLLRSESADSWLFRYINGFNADDVNRSYWAVWLEIGWPNSNIFQYLGLAKIPPSSLNPLYIKDISDARLYRFQHYRMLRPSTFTPSEQQY